MYQRTTWRCVAVLGCLLIGGVDLALPGQRPAQNDDPVPPMAGQPYAMGAVRVGKTFQIIRYRRDTGESWLAVGENWESIPETGPVPGGAYEVLMVATEEDFIAFRFDRKTGTTWQLRGRRWVSMKEPKP